MLPFLQKHTFHDNFNANQEIFDVSFQHVSHDRYLDTINWMMEWASSGACTSTDYSSAYTPLTNVPKSNIKVKTCSGHLAGGRRAGQGNGTLDYTGALEKKNKDENWPITIKLADIIKLEQLYQNSGTIPFFLQNNINIDIRPNKFFESHAPLSGLEVDEDLQRPKPVLQRRPSADP